MTKQINLTREVMKRISTIGLPCEEGTLEYDLINAYVGNNLNKLFGKTSVDESEYEVITINLVTTMSIKGYQSPIVFEVDRVEDEITVSAKDQKSGEVIFAINKKGGVYSNVFVDKDNDFEHLYTVSSLNDPEYGYIREKIDGDKKEIIFAGTLKSLNAKYKDREIFELTRTVPPEEKEQSFLKRLVDNVKGERYISVVTSSQSLDTVEFADRIFEKMESEADKFTVTSPDNVQQLKKTTK